MPAHYWHWHINTVAVAVLMDQYPSIQMYRTCREIKIDSTRGFLFERWSWCVVDPILPRELLRLALEPLRVCDD
jgi:hypothetical protein